MFSFLFVILVKAPPDILLGSIFNVSGCGLGTLETGMGALVSVGVAVVDARVIPWSGCTTPGSLSVLSTPRNGTLLGVEQTERLRGLVKPDHGMARASTTATPTD